MRLFLDAIVELTDDIEMLFYVEPGVEATPAAMRRAEHDLLAAGHIHAKVTWCPVAVPSTPRSFWNHYVSPATSICAQELYAGTSGAPQIAAFETALEGRPDLVFVRRLDAMCPVLLTRRELPRCSWISTTR